MEKKIIPTKVITGVCRWSYANVWQPKVSRKAQSEILGQPDHPEERYRNHREDQGSDSGGIRGRHRQAQGTSKSVPPLSTLKTPLRDGDTERPDDPAYANSYFVNANSITAPGVVDADRQPIIDTSEVYSGVYGRASINFYAYATKTAKGIACGLNNLMKVKDGEPLGGHSRAEDDFADIDDDFLS
mgnify:CR=1 FL=1